jgi:branched-chain amino acid transport system permease protein
LKGTITIFGIEILKTQALVIAAAILMLALLWFFVQRTKTGKAMQAVSEDKDAAALMGINVDQIIVITFAVGGALAGAAGVLYGLPLPAGLLFTGFLPGLSVHGSRSRRHRLQGHAEWDVLGIAKSLFPNLVLDGPPGLTQLRARWRFYCWCWC